MSYKSDMRRTIQRMRDQLNALESDLNKSEPEPRTPRLVEAVEITLAYVRNMDTEAVFESFHAMHFALAAEKKRQELVDELKRTIRVWQNRGCNESCVITAINNLDAYEKQ